MADTNIQSFTKDFLAVRISSSGNSSQTKISSKDSFSKELDKSSKQSFKTEDNEIKNTSGKSTVNEEVKKNQMINKKLKELENKAGSEVTAAAADNAAIASQTVTELKEAVAEQLGISVDELESLIDSMNFDDMALFDAEKLGMIVLQSNGLQQTQDLLFNQDAADEFKNIMALMEDAIEELEQAGIKVSDESFINMNTGENLQTGDETEPENADVTVKVKDDVTGTEIKNDAENIKADIPETDEKVADVLTKDVKTEMSDTDGEIKHAEENSIPAENVQTESETKYSENTNQQSFNDGKNHREHNVKADGSLVSETNVRFNPIEEIQVELTEKVGRSQAESIISQITEHIRFNVNSEFKSMEMQLYPEHLGKVGVQVAVKDGIVTAQLTAENESVKKAIEAQLLNLKESFNNQGLKVESIEVTIASHSFEDNNMHNQDGQSNKDGSKKNRRFNPSLLEELNDVTDEQSENTVMETLGNTVSYTA